MYKKWRERERERKKVIHARFNDGHAYKILHYQAQTTGTKEENRRKGRFVGSTCMFSSCASEERIERYCAHSHLRSLLCYSTKRDMDVFFSVFFFLLFSSIQLVFSCYYNIIIFKSK